MTQPQPNPNGRYDWLNEIFEKIGASLHSIDNGPIEVRISDKDEAKAAIIQQFEAMLAEAEREARIDELNIAQAVESNVLNDWTVLSDYFYKRIAQLQQGETERENEGE